MNELGIGPVGDEREGERHVEPPQHAVGKLDLTLVPADEEPCEEAPHRRPGAPGIARAGDAQALQHESRDADGQQQAQNDDVAGLGVKRAVRDATHDASHHGDAKGSAGDVDGEREEVQVEVALDEREPQIGLGGHGGGGDKQDDHGDVHGHVHEPGPAPLGHLHLQKGVAHRAAQTLAAPIGAILGLADLPQAPAPHEEDDGYGQRRDEAGVD